MAIEMNNKSSTKIRKYVFLSVSFLCGSLLLCLLATFQKQAIGAPFVIQGYVVPFLFGGMAGGFIGLYIYKIRELNNLLKERVNTLESIVPICSNCKKIRKPDSDPRNMDSWEQMEYYISERTNSEFSHGICPECKEELYGNQEWYKKTINT